MELKLRLVQCSGQYKILFRNMSFRGSVDLWKKEKTLFGAAVRWFPTSGLWRPGLPNQTQITFLTRHCTSGEDKNKLQILLGEWKKSDLSYAAKNERLRIWYSLVNVLSLRLRMDIAEMHVHPEFDQALLDNDFVLFKWASFLIKAKYDHHLCTG